MIRVGIITQYHNNINYGGLLQAYALQWTVQQLGMQCEVIDYVRGKHGNKNESNINKFLRYFSVDSNSAFELAYEQVSTKINGILLGFDKQKKVAISALQQRSECDKFRQQIPHSKGTYDENDIIDTLKTYDAYIVGSDQVWNPFSLTEIEMLSFVTEERKKIAYAASVSTHIFDDYSKELFKEHLPKFNQISVRESSSVSVLKLFTDKRIDNVLDPVFLPGTEFWEAFLEEYTENSNYIFAYFLGTSEKNRRLLKTIGKKTGKIVIYLPLKENTRNNKYAVAGDIQLYNVKPQLFLGLIKNADMVVTDSFHGTAFSIIFNKQFINLFRYKNKNRRNTNSRLKDLLSSLELEERIISTVDEIDRILTKDIDYKEVNEKLKRMFDYSLGFLKRSLYGD